MINAGEVISSLARNIDTLIARISELEDKLYSKEISKPKSEPTPDKPSDKKEEPPKAEKSDKKDAPKDTSAEDLKLLLDSEVKVALYKDKDGNLHPDNDKDRSLEPMEMSAFLKLLKQ